MRRIVLVVMILAGIVIMLAGCNTTRKANMEESLRWDNPVGYVTSNDVKQVTKGMTYADIITQLGPTRDIGSGLHVAHYIVDDTKSLYLSFGNPEDICPKDGVGLLQSLEAIDFSTIGIRGVVKDIVHGKDGITMLVEGKQETDTALTAANVTVTMQSRVYRGQTLIEGSFGFSEIKEGDTVEVTFAGPVTMSYPVMGVAAIVRILMQSLNSEPA
ncbi:MAG TPA: hypothetical protein VN478_02015 [Clostridia bacterium]|nr:hypothetical protein [Clostridia bacterium]